MSTGIAKSETNAGETLCFCLNPLGYDQKVYENILHTIGNTPLVRLNKIPKDHGLDCQIFAKCELFNPGGSIKDRIAYTMMIDAENKGVAKSNTHFVEPTSGNTGIGLALAADIHEYKCTIVTPDKNSDEKINTMRLFGANVIQTPSQLKVTDPNSYIGVTKKILHEDPTAVCLNQYCNKVNPDTHYEFTADEIISALGSVDMVVAGTGTGGTLNGVAHRFKEVNPNCVVVAIDPLGSIMFGEKNQKSYLVEGIGGDFVPDVLDTNVDRLEQPNDYESFNMAREIIKKEGILCGGSSGAALSGAIKAAQALKLGRDKRVVVIFADSIRNYMTKFVCDQWMEANLFKEPPVHANIKWWNKSVLSLEVLSSVPMIVEDQKCREALDAMSSKYNVAVVINKNGNYVGAVSKDSLRRTATNPKMVDNINFDDPISDHLIKTTYKIAVNVGEPTVGLISRMLDITPFVVIVEQKKQDDPQQTETFVPKGIVTPELVLEYIWKNQNEV